MKSPVVKRSIVIAGHKTSVSLEDAFWTGLRDIAVARNMTLSDLVAAIDAYLRETNNNPTPLVWTASVETILEKIARCKATFETLH